jgi:hypothetical protein
VSDDLSGYPGAPPGWYPDPAGGPGQRWWDGYAWTEATVLPAVPPPPPGPPTFGPPTSGLPPTGQPVHPVQPPQSPSLPPPPTPHWAASQPGYGVPPSYGGAPAYGLTGGRGGVAPQLVARELSLFALARVAVAAPAVYYLANLISQQIYRAQYLRVGHQFRIIWEAAQHHQTAPAFDSSGTGNPISPLVGLVAIAGVVIACIWQHRAASAARALGFPATRSPGWGVGCWFVPIVNLWMPYQAIRDCLPPDDPNRRLVLRWWLTFLAAGWVTAGAGVAAFFSTGVALGIAIPAAVLCVALLAAARQVVAAIGTAHRAALAPHAGV